MVEVKLIVVPGLPKDSKQMIVRIDGNTRKKLGLKTGDPVKVIGPKKTKICSVKKIVGDWVGKGVVMAPTCVRRGVRVGLAKTVILRS